jgi:serine-type D-Ala-D-Ala carboxypeptidase/endopeptidase
MRHSSILADSAVRTILAERIDVQRQSVGIAVGLIGPEGKRVVAHGQMAMGDARPVGGDTIFEIGSITKVFTALLLTEMVERGEVALDDPIAKYLPEFVSLPGRKGHAITLLDLATHTSGLPRLPSDLSPGNSSNPYADYSADRLYEFLSHCQLKRDMGTQQEYSNLGGGLLGHVLEIRAGTGYEALVRARICGPLGMNDTRVLVTPEMNARFARGHDAVLKPVENWDFAVLAGAGALRSTVNDLLEFAAANLGYAETSLGAATAAMLKVKRTAGPPRREIALGWQLSAIGGKEVVWHNGGTGGYRSFLGFDRKIRRGVVVLSNARTAMGVDDIGLHLLDANVPLAKSAAGGAKDFAKHDLLSLIRGLARRFGRSGSSKC